MKTLISLFVFACLGVLLKPPLLSQQILSVAGNHNTSDQVVVHWTLGEVAIQSHHSSDLSIKEGFLQPTMVVEDVMTATRNASQFMVHPNPTQNYIIISNNDFDFTDAELFLSNLKGERVMLKKIQTAEKRVQVDIRNLPAGAYIMHLKEQGNDQLHHLRIIKIN